MRKISKYCFSLLLLLTLVRCGGSYQPHDLNTFSQHFLKDAREGKDCAHYLDTLKQLDLEKFTHEINTGNEQLAFWINNYNALIITKLKEDPSAYRDREHFFGSPSIHLMGMEVSFNDIENVILRSQHSENETEILRSLSLKKPDYRIHFALNCGAKSCPPIAYYSPENIQQQLALAERSFIESNSIYDPENNTLTVSELFNWYSADFGGEDGIVQLHKKIGVIPPWAKPELKFTPYDWRPNL
jgi:hypothetical protein